MFEFGDGGQHCDHESGHNVALGSQTVAILVNGVEAGKGWKRELTHHEVVEPTHLKTISQIGSLPQVRMKIKNENKTTTYCRSCLITSSSSTFTTTRPKDF